MTETGCVYGDKIGCVQDGRRNCLSAVKPPERDSAAERHILVTIPDFYLSDIDVTWHCD